MFDNKSICFVTTGDIKNIATAKRALGMSSHLVDFGWYVTILMEDTIENKHRISIECDERVNVIFFCKSNCIEERRVKDKYIRAINPDYLYICAFVPRNIVGIGHRSKKIVEHSELQSYISDIKWYKRFCAYVYEYYSIFYSDGLVNASKFLQLLYYKRSKKLFINRKMLYLPYAYNSKVCYIDSEAHRLFKKQIHCKYFLFLGSLAINYGAMTMVKAFEIIKERDCSLKLLLCGKGSAYDIVTRYIEEHKLGDTIYTLGYVSENDIAGYFTLADGFISPMNDTIQDWARCPSKLYMYLPYKKPIITCKIGEPYEVLKDSGYYFESSSSVSLANCILELNERYIDVLKLDPLQHEWANRTREFNDWIKKIE